MKVLSRMFRLLAGAGFLASAAVHVTSWTEAAIPRAVVVLYLGVFVVWFRSAAVTERLTPGVRPKDAWKAVLRLGPRWMRIAGTLLVVYATALFVFSFLGVFVGEARSGNEAHRTLSAVMLMLYGVAFLTLRVAQHVGPAAMRRRCRNGHRLVYPTAGVCEECGAPAVERNLVRRSSAAPRAGERPPPRSAPCCAPRRGPPSSTLGGCARLPRGGGAVPLPLLRRAPSLPLRLEREPELEAGRQGHARVERSTLHVAPGRLLARLVPRDAGDR